MSWDDNNLYYRPEEQGCATVGSVDTGGAWEFDTLLVVLRKETGAVYWGTDSGCSCPTPFDGTTLTDFREIHSGAEFAREARQWLDQRRHGYSGARDEIESLILKVRSALKAKRGGE